MARTFVAPTDSVGFTPGGVSGKGRNLTIVTLAMRTGAGTGGAFMSGSAVGTEIIALAFDTSKLYSTGDFGAGGQTVNQSQWYVAASSKAAGSANYRYHLLPLGGAWTHQDGTFAVSDGAGVDALVAGQWGGSDDNVSIAALAVFNGALADAAIEALGSSAMATWLAASPLWAVQFNQASTAEAVNDLTAGGGNQNAISGTSVGASDPPGWTYFAPSTAGQGMLAFFGGVR